MPSITTLKIEDAAVAVMRLPAVDRAGRREAERAATAALAASLFGQGSQVEHTPQGAPRVAGRRVSIAHSAAHAAMAYHHTAVIGIDIESPRPQLERVKSRFLNADELRAFGTNPDMLLRAWTAKEAVYKALETLGPDLTAITLSPDLATAAVPAPASIASPAPAAVATDSAPAAAAAAAGRHFTLRFLPLPPDILCLALASQEV